MNEKVTLVYYDASLPKKALNREYQHIKDHLGGKVLFVPKCIDILLDASEEQLIEFRNMIDEALAYKKSK